MGPVLYMSHRPGLYRYRWGIGWAALAVLSIVASLALTGPARVVFLVLAAAMLLLAGFAFGRGTRPGAASDTPGPARLHTILDTLDTAVIAVDREGQITLVNAAARRLLDVGPDGLHGVSLARLADDERLDFVRRTGLGADTLTRLFEGLRADGADEIWSQLAPTTVEIPGPQPRYLRRSVVPLHDGDGRLDGVLITLSDQTQPAELLRARDELTSMIVHDLRGPLTAINTSFRLLDELATGDDPVSAGVRHTVSLSAGAVRKLLHLVDSLLDITKLQGGGIDLNRQPVALDELVDAVVRDMRLLAHDADVEIEQDVPADLPPLLVDPYLLERVVLNLLDNALKFTPAGGQVVVAARQPDPAEGVVRVDVRDTGPGIPDAYKADLFNWLAQVPGQQGARRGTGIGLTFCKLAVEAHGGRIWIEDNPAGGAVIAFTLPVSDDSEQAAPDLAHVRAVR